MANLIQSSTYGVQKQILIAPELAFTIPVQVTNTGVEANGKGKKIIKAGTAVGGATNVLLNRNTALTVTNTSENATQSQGVLLHDVDVTDGETNATMVVAGYIDINKIEESAQPVEAVQTALTKITFMKGV